MDCFFVVRSAAGTEAPRGGEFFGDYGPRNTRTHDHYINCAKFLD